MKRLAVVLLVMVLSSPAYAYEFAEKWDKEDTAYQATYLTLTAVDGAQTHWMAKNDWKWDDKEWKEFCPFLGTKPHQDKVDIMIPAGMVLHTGIAFVLPPKYKLWGFEINPRRIWQMLFIGIEAAAVGNNIGVGARIEF